MRRALALLLSLLALGCAELPWRPGAPGKQVLGAVEVFRVADVDLEFSGRVDTGAESSAIHATDLRFDTPVEPEAAAGRRLEFTLQNERGQRRRLSRVVADVVQVRTAQGTETRLRVPLRLAFGGIEKSVRVSLRDRGAMTHKLLVGRDWLAGDFLVDVERPATAP